jgi:predicted ArsR family transcriptional regulator
MMRRYTVAEAAEALGISQAAVRARIHRGTLKTEREDGMVYVWVDDEQYAEQHANVAPDVVEVLREQNGDLREQIDFLRDELRRKDTIIMAMTQRIPELEPAQERPEGHETPTEEAEPRRPSTGGAQEAAERRSWWSRIFRS